MGRRRSAVVAVTINKCSTWIISLLARRRRSRRRRRRHPEGGGGGLWDHGERGAHRQLSVVTIAKKVWN